MRAVRGLLLAAAALGLTACEEPEGARPDAEWLRDESWNDGAAVVSVYEGRVYRYGHWRAAEARDYVIREYFDPDELTKRDRKTDLPVLKANRHVTFNTGTYDYRRMVSLFFDRRDASLVKAVGSSQEGCGLVFLRWDRNARRLLWDSYWEGEGRGGRDLAKSAGEYFVDELSYVARGLEEGAEVTVRPTLARNRVGAGRARKLTVKRDGRAVRLVDGDGVQQARFEFDDGGDLVRWRIVDAQKGPGEGAEEFERTVRRRLYYWQKTDPEDERLLR